MTTKVASPRARKSFSRLEHVLDLPNLIDIQKASFQWFLDEGLRETIDDISPIEDYTGSLAVEFGAYKFGQPQFSIKECREKDLTYQAPLSMTVRFVNKDTGEIREQTVFMGDFPMMTGFGTFIINGTERVIVTQLVRSPGAYLMEPKDPTKQVFTANLMPSRGSWLELEIDKKGVVYARIDRKRKLPITTLLRALPAEDPSTGFALDTSTNEAILALFDNSSYIVNTLEKDPSTREEEALIEVFKKQRPGEPPTLDNARNLLRALFFDPKRYDLTKVGRYKLNQRLGVDVPDDVRVLTIEDIVALVRKLIELPVKLGVPEDSKDFAADAIALPRAPIAAELGIGEFEAGLDPAGKLARIRALQQSGLRVAMVGDGINDAAALAQADAGIAMGTGADLAQEAGDVLLLRAQPSAIPAALDLARSTVRVMRQNLAWAAAYNLLGIPLAAGLLYPAFHILLTPWLAAAAMALSSVCVLANSLRLRRWLPSTARSAPAS